MDNVHVSKDASKDIVEKMRKLRIEWYGDENVYGEKDYNGPFYPRNKDITCKKHPASSHSSTKHLHYIC